MLATNGACCGACLHGCLAAHTVRALAVRVLASLSLWPHAWESHYWCATTDFTLLLALVTRLAEKRSLSLLAAERTAAVTDASRIVRYQVAVYYLSAAFFKLNTSFLDHRYSCASPYLAQTSPPMCRKRSPRRPIWLSSSRSHHLWCSSVSWCSARRC